MKTEELLQRVSNSDIIIFGTGFVAEVFWYALKSRDLSSRVRGFMKTKVQPGETFHGLPVFDYESAPPLFVCMAVHEAVAQEAFALFNAEEKERMVWIYPNIHELLFGTPLIRDQQVSLKELLKKQPKSDLWLAVRYMAADACLSSQPVSGAGDLYIRAMSVHCSPETARKRFQKMKELAESMAAGGYQQDKPILIDTEGRIIDGMHRTSAAAALGIKEIPCNVVQASEAYSVLLTEKVRLTENALINAGFTAREIERIRLAGKQMRERQNSQMNPEVSVIVPVYNVEDYLDTFMESLCAQSFRDMEILLINDGSADGSEKKCREWAEKDDRIRFVSKENEGVAPTRNLGVSMACGKYIAFADPDDWMDPDYIKKLYEALEENGADFAECDIWRYDNRSGKKTLRCCYGRMGVPYTLEEHMKYAPTATYKSMSRRELWTENRIQMPSCSFESPAVYALVLALSRKVINIPEPLYYYRTFRENSLIENGYAHRDGSANNTLGIEAMSFLLSEFKRCGIYEQYKDILEGVVKYRLSDILATQFHRKTEEDYRILLANCRSFLGRTFPNGHNETYITWGGFNLNRIAVHMNWLHDPGCRFNFSSIISVCGEGSNGEDSNGGALPYTHKNHYRQIMLERERRYDIWRMAAEIKPSYLIMDLIEERFDLIDAGSRYVTKSDAYDGKLSGGCEGAAILERNSRECTELWKKCIASFFERIRSLSPGIRLILIENYLSETFGKPGKRSYFEEADQIRKQNEILREYYAYIETLCPDAVIIRPADNEWYFTDENFGYGAYPWHLNEIVNQKIAAEAESRLLRTCSDE